MRSQILKIVNKILEKKPVNIVSCLGTEMQLKLLKLQPVFKRVIYIDAQKIENLCYDNLEIAAKNYIPSHSFLFSFDLNEFHCNGETHKTINELLNGVEYNETTDYKRFMKKLENGWCTKGIQNESDIYKYLDYLCELIDNIKKNGIKEPTLNDKGIQVCIDENGRV